MLPGVVCFFSGGKKCLHRENAVSWAKNLISVCSLVDYNALYWYYNAIFRTLTVTRHNCQAA